MKKNLKKSTLCVHGGWEPKNGESRQLPIIQSTTFKYDNSEEMAMLFDLKKEGYFYTRLRLTTRMEKFMHLSIISLLNSLIIHKNF